MNYPKLLVILILFGTIFISCEKVQHFIKPNKSQNLKPGEWFNEKDSMNGLSVLKDRLGIFKNMEFSSDDIYKYNLIDSIAKSGETERITGTYLILNREKDTLKFEILFPKDSVIELKINGEFQAFKLKKLDDVIKAMKSKRPANTR